jgi:hypothetical protein
MKDKNILHVLKLVLASIRPMPAHFTCGNGRNQTFLIDSDDLTVEDEYEMASHAWYKIPVGLSGSDAWVCLKIAEDVMVGSFIAVKEGGADNVGLLREEMINANLISLSKAERQATNELLATKEVQKYLDFCSDFGANQAGG